MKFVTAKYLRRFCFDKIIELEVPNQLQISYREGFHVELELNIMALARQANKYYSRYLEYVEGSEEATLNILA